MSKKSVVKSIKNLNLLDSFLFCETTEIPENAEYIARVIIRRVLGWNVEHIQVETEKQHRGVSLGRKGIRLDLKITEEANGRTVRIYDIEPNKYVEPQLAKRNRYYLSLMDIKFLKSSEEYEELPEYFSIWILPYDPFGCNRMVYTVKNMVVEDTQLVYNDGVTRLFLYTGGEIGGSEELKALLKYFVESEEDNAVDPELHNIQTMVETVKNSEEVGERYMTLEDMVKYEKRDSYEEGKSDGMEVGISACISMCRKLGHSDEEIVDSIMEGFSLTQEEATQKVMEITNSNN